jgi:hypothetical protein
MGQEVRSKRTISTRRILYSSGVWGLNQEFAVSGMYQRVHEVLGLDLGGLEKHSERRGVLDVACVVGRI